MFLVNNKESYYMMLNIEKLKCFDLPEGNYRARFTENKPILKMKDGKSVNYCRLLFEVTQGSQIDKCAGRNFLPCLVKNSQLREFLCSWLGSGVFETTSSRKFELDSLIGKEADIVIRHIINGPDMPPFCQLAAIYPAGTLVTEPPCSYMKGLAA